MISYVTFCFFGWRPLIYPSSTPTLSYPNTHTRNQQRQVLVWACLASNGAQNGSFPQASRVATVARWKVTSPPTSLPLSVSVALCRALMYVATSVEKCSVSLPPPPQLPPSPFLSCLLHLFIPVPFLLPPVSSFISFYFAPCSSLIWFISPFSLLLYILKKAKFKIRNTASTKIHKRAEIHITKRKPSISSSAPHHGFPAISFLNPAVAPHQWWFAVLQKKKMFSPTGQIVSNLISKSSELLIQPSY